MEDQAKKITKAIGNLKWLAELIKDYSVPLLASDEFLKTFTDHSVKHCWRLLSNLSLLVDERMPLDPPEAMVLFGSAFLHDIAIACPEAVLFPAQGKRGWYEAELRQNHGAYSARYIRDFLVPEFTGMAGSTANAVRQNLDLMEGIARICEFHTARFYEEDQLKAPSHRLLRLPVIGALFVLADTLDTGAERVKVSEVIHSTLPLEGREYWLSHACISGFHVRGDDIVLTARKPPALGRSEFSKIILQPFMTELNRLLEWAQTVFSRFEIRPLHQSAVLSIEEEGAPSQLRDTTLLRDRHAFEQKHKRQRAKWLQRLDAVTFLPGVIARGQVGDEFHVLRRWGSSTHRLFSVRDGLQKGGGYFLSWNGGGLAIDPGYDFLANAFSMQFLRFTIQDFDAALVSHSHDDHTQDLEPLLSLQYRLRRDPNGESVPARFPDFPVVCSEGVRWKYAPMAAANEFLRLLPIIPTQFARRIVRRATGPDLGSPFFAATGVGLEAIVSYHTEKPWHLHNTGITVKLYLNHQEENFCWGYTSDTGFDPELIEFFSDADLLLLHLGNKTDNGRPPRHHLGEDGCINLISSLKVRGPRLFILGEFGVEEFLRGGYDDRVSYTTYIEQVTGVRHENKRVLPADIGLRVQLPNLAVWCETAMLSRRPTADNPAGSWCPFLQVVPILGPFHQIHYSV